MRERVKRLDKQFLLKLIPRKFPSLAQLQYIDLFLEGWEKHVVGAAGFIAGIGLLGIFFSVWHLITIPAPTIGGDFQEVIVGAPRYINPLFATSDSDRTLTHLIYLPLCDTQSRGAAAIAESCDIVDNKRATIKIAHRTWDDGTPITASDITFTLERIQNKDTHSPWYALATRFTVNATDANTVIITAKSPTPELQTLLSIGPLPEHIWKSVDADKMRSNTLNLKPIGSGPYRLARLLADSDGAPQNLTLDAVTSFAPRRAYIDEINFRIADDDASARELFRTRQVDTIFLYDPAVAEELLKRDVNRFELTSPTVVSLFFNPSRGALLRKKDIRTAFSLALDRARIVKNALHGNGVPTRAPFPLSIVREPSALEPDTDIGAARALFKSALPATATTTLVLGYPALSAYESVANEIRDELAPFGITIQPVMIDSFDSNSNLLEYDLLLLGQDYGSGNAYPYWHSASSGQDGANYARYQIKEVDGWLEQLGSESRQAQRETLFDKLTQRLVNDVPAIFLFQPTYQYYAAKKIDGVIVPANADPSDRFERVTDWYTQTRRAHK